MVVNFVGAFKIDLEEAKTASNVDLVKVFQRADLFLSQFPFMLLSC